jgi:hypothetical protein
MPSALKGLLATLLSPPQYHAALNMMPHTLASVDQSPVRHPKTPPFRNEDADVCILEGHLDFK